MVCIPLFRRQSASRSVSASYTDCSVDRIQDNFVVVCNNKVKCNSSTCNFFSTNSYFFRAKMCQVLSNQYRRTPEFCHPHIAK